MKNILQQETSISYATATNKESTTSPCANRTQEKFKKSTSAAVSETLSPNYTRRIIEPISKRINRGIVVPGKLTADPLFLSGNIGPQPLRPPGRHGGPRLLPGRHGPRRRLPPGSHGRHPRGAIQRPPLRRLLLQILPLLAAPISRSRGLVEHEVWQAEEEAERRRSLCRRWVLGAAGFLPNGRIFIKGNRSRDGARIGDRRPGLAAPNFLAVWIGEDESNTEKIFCLTALDFS